NISEIFTKIYAMNHWGSNESASGRGSTLRYTENLRKELPELFKRFSISSIYDAPCGDFNWMKTVIEENNIVYFGADIVPVLIERLRKNYENSRVSFYLADITADEFQKADLWICRDCLFHLSNMDIYFALQRFLSSGTPFILTTTHTNTSEFENSDIHTGSF